MTPPAADYSDTTYIEPPNPALAKLGGALPRLLPEEFAERAERAIGEHAMHFDQEMRRQIATLSHSVEVASEIGADRLQGLYPVLHEMRGQCGTFGHEIVGHIANALCGYLEETHRRGMPVRRHVVLLHVKSLKRAAEDETTARRIAPRLLDNLARLSRKALETPDAIAPDEPADDTDGDGDEDGDVTAEDRQPDAWLNTAAPKH